MYLGNLALCRFHSKHVALRKQFIQPTFAKFSFGYEQRSRQWKREYSVNDTVCPNECDLTKEFEESNTSPLFSVPLPCKQCGYVLPFSSRDISRNNKVHRGARSRQVFVSIVVIIVYSPLEIAIEICIHPIFADKPLTKVDPPFLST
jgi:hypothetical protein